MVYEQQLPCSLHLVILYSIFWFLTATFVMLYAKIVAYEKQRMIFRDFDIGRDPLLSYFVIM